MCFIYFKFCLLNSKLESEGHCLWEKQHHDTILSPRNLEAVFCTACHCTKSTKTKILQCLGLNLEIASYSYSWKPNPVYIMVFGVASSNHNIMPSFIFPHGFTFNIRGIYQMPGGASAALDWEGCHWKTLYLAKVLCTMPHKQVGCENISAITSLLTFSSPDCIPLDYYR